MKRSLVRQLCCPSCAGDLELTSWPGTPAEIESGELLCSSCGCLYPIVRAIPRFVPTDNYAGTFGLQWNRFRQTQLDSYTGTHITQSRFAVESGWSEAALAGAAVLDAGCGAGRFAEVALSWGAQVFAVDYSTAVDACWANLRHHPGVHVVQADIYALPFREANFDYVYCFGVLQHTPDPRRAFLALPPKLRPGGWLAIDIYPRIWTAALQPKYWLRPLTSRMSTPVLLQAVERAVPVLLPLSRALARIPVAGPLLRRLVPVANYEGIYPLGEKQLREWAVLDTFDWLSPVHDRPQTAGALVSWLREAGLDDIEVLRTGHLVGRGRKPIGRGAS
jgi:SAM-dependent methyltransferase